jgi:hypothetical protein
MTVDFLNQHVNDDLSGKTGEERLLVSVRGEGFPATYPHAP